MSIYLFWDLFFSRQKMYMKLDCLATFYTLIFKGKKREILQQFSATVALTINIHPLKHVKKNFRLWFIDRKHAYRQEAR